MSTYTTGDSPVPDYLLDRPLGSGGIGQVWLATGPGKLKRALKIVSGLDQHGGRKEFRALQLVKNVNHPHLIPIMGIWLKDAEGQLISFPEEEHEPPRTSNTEGRSANESVGRGDRQARLPSDTLMPSKVSTPLELNENVSETTSTGDTDSNKPGASVNRVPQSEPAELIIAMGLGDMSLLDRLRHCQQQGREGIPCDELLHYLLGAAEAIDYLNAKGIQHCDIKPQNILIVGHDAQVCDFGLAQAIGPNAHKTQNPAMTYAYAAPEVISVGLPSESTDLYCLAVTYVELRTGKLPYQRADSVAGLVRSKMEGELDLNDLLLDEQQIIRRALEPEPSHRDFENCQAFVSSLQRCLLSSSQDEQEKTGTHSRFRKLIIFGATAATTVIFSLIVLFAFYGWKGNRSLGFVQLISERIDEGDLPAAVELAKNLEKGEQKDQQITRIANAWLERLEKATDAEEIIATLRLSNRILPQLPNHNGADSFRTRLSVWFGKQYDAVADQYRTGDRDAAIQGVGRLQSYLDPLPEGTVAETQYRSWLLEWRILRDRGETDLSQLAANLPEMLAPDQRTDSSVYGHLLWLLATRTQDPGSLLDRVDLRQVADLWDEQVALMPWEQGDREDITQQILKEAAPQISVLPDEQYGQVKRLAGPDGRFKLYLADVSNKIDAGRMSEAGAMLSEDIMLADLQCQQLTEPQREEVRRVQALYQLSDPDVSLAQASQAVQELTAVSVWKSAFVKVVQSRLERDVLSTEPNDLPAVQSLCESAQRLIPQLDLVDACWTEAVLSGDRQAEPPTEIVSRIDELRGRMLPDEVGDHAGYYAFVQALICDRVGREPEQAAEYANRAATAVAQDDFWSERRRLSIIEILLDVIEESRSSPTDVLESPFTQENLPKALRYATAAELLLPATSLPSLQRRVRENLAIANYFASDSADRLTTVGQQLDAFWAADPPDQELTRQLHFLRAKAYLASPSLSEDQLRACLESCAAVVSVPQQPRASDLFQQLLEPALRLIDSNSLESVETLPADLRTGIAQLLVAKARWIQNDDKVAQLAAGSRLEQTYRAYELASQCDPRPEYLVEQGLAYKAWKEDFDPEDTLQKLRELSKLAIELSSTNGRAYMLRGYASLLASRLQSTTQEQKELLRQAILDFNASLRQDGDDPVCLTNRSAAYLELAFLMDKGMEAERKKAEIALKMATKDAERATRQSPDNSNDARSAIYSWIALGNAHEDRAFYLQENPETEYQLAVEAFQRANTIAQVFSLGPLERITSVSLARCLMRQALALPDDAGRKTTLKKAAAVLERFAAREPSDPSNSDFRAQEAEMRLWLGSIYDELREDDPQLLDKAARCLLEAWETAKEHDKLKLPLYQLRLAEFELQSRKNPAECLKLAEPLLATAVTEQSLRQAAALCLASLSAGPPDQLEQWTKRILAEYSQVRPIQLELRLQRINRLADQPFASASDADRRDFEQDKNALVEYFGTDVDKLDEGFGRNAIGFFCVLQLQDFAQAAEFLEAGTTLLSDAYRKNVDLLQAGNLDSDERNQVVAAIDKYVLGCILWANSLRQLPDCPRSKLEAANQRIDLLVKQYHARNDIYTSLLGAQRALQARLKP